MAIQLLRRWWEQQVEESQLPTSSPVQHGTDTAAAIVGLWVMLLLFTPLHCGLRC